LKEEMNRSEDVYFTCTAYSLVVGASMNKELSVPREKQEEE
jgi:hypothetical protein